MIHSAPNCGDLSEQSVLAKGEAMARLRPYFLRNHGVPQVDDRRVQSGIILINPNGLRWCDAPTEDGPDKKLYNRRKRRNDMGVFAPIVEGLAANKPDNETISMMQPISRHTVQPPACRSKGDVGT